MSNSKNLNRLCRKVSIVVLLTSIIIIFIFNWNDLSRISHFIPLTPLVVLSLLSIYILITSKFSHLIRLNYGGINDSDLKYKFSFSRLLKLFIKTFAPAILLFFIAFQFAEKILQLFIQPFKGIFNNNLVFTGYSEAFFILLKFSFLFSLLATSPYIHFVLCNYLAKGFNRNEKIIVLIYSFLSLFGAIYLYLVVVRKSAEYFLSYSSEFISTMPSMAGLSSLIINVLLYIFLLFWLPTLIYFVAKYKINDLLAIRLFLSIFVFIYLFFFVAHIFLIPVMLMFPIIIVAEIGLGLAYISDKSTWSKIT
jgi:sec-independent protein translocase protein TatC